MVKSGAPASFPVLEDPPILWHPAYSIFFPRLNFPHPLSEKVRAAPCPPPRDAQPAHRLTQRRPALQAGEQVVRVGLGGWCVSLCCSIVCHWHARTASTDSSLPEILGLLHILCDTLERGPLIPAKTAQPPKKKKRVMRKQWPDSPPPCTRSIGETQGVT